MSMIVSQRAKDQPMASVDTAVWWVEYVMRHSTTHFKSPSMKQSWWKKRLLDVWLVVYAILFITAFTAYKTTKFVVCSIVRSLMKRNRSKRIKIL